MYVYDKKKPFMSYLKRIYSEYLSSDEKYTSFDISPFCRLFYDYFGKFNQSDSGEYIYYLFDKLESENKLIDELLNGKTELSICCDNCNHIIKKVEPFRCSILSINEHDNVYDMLKDVIYNEEEIKDYSCDNCKKKGNCKKITKWIEYPNYLVIILNRFNNNNTKNKKHIQMNEMYMLNNKEYNYCCSVHHFGETVGGHYMSVVKNNETYYVFDDSSIGYTNSDNVYNSNTSYILFYYNK
jgi:ubiquitin C-terminal hydrolase